MKKIIILSLLFVLVAPISTLFAVDNNRTSYSEAIMILNSSKNLSSTQFNLINDLSSDLSPMERTMLFESNKQSPAIPFVVNLLVGFGIGSFVQGDSTGGNISLVGDLVSIALVYTGYAQALNAAFNSASYDGTEGAGMMLIGGIGLLATRVFELIRPFSFASDYNQKLSSALMSVSMIPVINQNNEIQTRLVAKINF